MNNQLYADMPYGSTSCCYFLSHHRRYESNRFEMKTSKCKLISTVNRIKKPMEGFPLMTRFSSFFHHHTDGAIKQKREKNVKLTADTSHIHRSIDPNETLNFNTNLSENVQEEDEDEEENVQKPDLSAFQLNNPPTLFLICGELLNFLLFKNCLLIAFPLQNGKKLKIKQNVSLPVLLLHPAKHDSSVAVCCCC